MALPEYDIQKRRDSAANWTSVNPVLSAGEDGLETDTGKLKTGDGVSDWNSLAYSILVPADIGQRVASLVNGKVPSSQIDALVDWGTIGGDIANQSDLQTTFAQALHGHEISQTFDVVSGVADPTQFSSISDAISAAIAQTPASTKRMLVRVHPGEYTEAPFNIPSYVYVVGLDPWGTANVKTSDNNADFISLGANAGLFNVGVTGPTGAQKSAIVQTVSGTTKLYWLNIKAGYYGITLKPSSGVARCHCIGVVTDGATMNRMFNYEYGFDGTVGTGVFILIQSGPMVTTWTGTNPAGVYLAGDGISSSPKAAATLDLCQFRGNAPTNETLNDVFADNGALVRGICCSFAGATTFPAGSTRVALHIGTNNGAGYKTHLDVNSSQIKPGGYNKDIWIHNDISDATFQGVATEANLDLVEGARFVGNFSDSSFGEVIYGELYIGNKQVKTPLTSYVSGNVSTGLVSGGACTRGVGRILDVASGRALIQTLSGVKVVDFSQTSLTIPQNTTHGHIVVDEGGVVQNVNYHPTGTDLVTIGEVTTNNTDIVGLFQTHTLLPQFRPRLSSWFMDVVGPINVDGGVVTCTGNAINVTDSAYYEWEEELATVGGSAVTFTYWYKDGLGGWNHLLGSTVLDNTKYDDGSGTLVNLTTDYHKRDVIYVVGNAGGTDYHVVYGQDELHHDSDLLTNPSPPDVLLKHACRLAAFTIHQGEATPHAVLDQRPRLGQLAPTTTTVTTHNDLLGRDSPIAHSQYQLISQKDQADGYLGLDNLGKADPTKIGTITDYTHGDQSGGTLHALASGASSGFMSSSDKSKIDAITAENIPTTDQKAALVGTSGTASVTNPYVTTEDIRLGIRSTKITAAQNFTNTGTLAAVTDIGIPVVAGTYTVRADILYQSTAATTGIAFSLNGPTSSLVTMNKRAFTGATTALNQSANAFATVQNTTAVISANTTYKAEIDAVVVFTTSGNLTLLFASETGVSVSVQPGTTLYGEKIA